MTSGRYKYESKWVEKAEKVLLNKKIVKIEWISENEMKELGWHNASIILTLDDGTEIMPQMDDEGNNAGALLWISPKETVTHPSYPGEEFTKTEVFPVF